ncbi:MAG: hypothetical protein HY725_15605 [Candidatus Rokubacteria bacterium]|nr:hypothetical protein [Candidatus Rokubacteria bacterium]
MKRSQVLWSSDTQLPTPVLKRLDEALLACGYSYTSGKTHNFYHYPARFSPEIARCVIGTFSRPGDLVIDPFMGGGTSVIEALTTGRRVIGVDINSLALFVSLARTTPLSARDEAAVRRWAEKAASYANGADPVISDPSVRHLPWAIRSFVATALRLAEELPLRRQRNFSRCALLRLGQWALDCRDFVAPRRSRLAKKLPQLVEEMLGGLGEFVASCREAGVSRRTILRNRVLLHRSAVGLEEDEHLWIESARPRLAFTSPPYPSVHVLYHRWQYRGRKETGAPYWIANIPDGYYASYYTGGSRTPTGEQHYFDMVTAAFRSVRSVIDPQGWVVQLIGFADTGSQLPRYLEAMDTAGFQEILPTEDGKRLGRRVPNRKWYANLKGPVDASSELLLFHKPR